MPAEVPLIPRQILFGNPQNTAPALSPDGTQLGYLAPDPKGVLNVWIRSLGAEDARVITSDAGRGVPFFMWQWDGQHVLHIQDQDGDENWHLYQTHVKTRQTLDLTPFENVQAQLVAAEPDLPNQLLVALNDRDPSLHDVHRLDLARRLLKRVTTNPGDVTAWTADHHLQVRACSAMSPAGDTIIRVRETAEDEWRELMRWGPEESFGGILGFSADNRRLRVICSVGANAARLLELDLATGAQTVRAEDPHFDVSGVMIHPTSHELEAVQFTRERTDYLVLKDEVREDFERLRIHAAGDFSVVSRDLKDKSWVVGYTQDTAPVSYYNYQRSNGALQFLFSTRPELATYPQASMKPISFEARDGMRIYGYLTQPADSAVQCPLVLLVHGGPWTRDTWGLENEVQWLANRGYAVLQVNFRGSTGYGKRYLNAGNREWAGKMHDDLIDAKNWAIKKGIADSDLVGVYGGSYGGYAVLVALAFTPAEFACGVDIVGPSNLITLIESIPSYWAPMRAIFDKRVGHLETEAEFLRSRSPLHRVDQIRKPLLIAQGANDPRVKKSESDQIAGAVRANGQSVMYLLFGDEGHGFMRPENRLKFYAAAEEFLAAHLGGRVAPPSKEERWEDLLQE